LAERASQRPLGTLVRYADDFVVMCRTRSECEQAEARVRQILARLGLELHPDKARRVELLDGKESFDSYVWRRLGDLRIKRKNGKLDAGDRARWSRDYFHGLGLHRLRRTVRYPEPA